MGFPEKLQELRAKRQMGQALLAERIGLHVSQLRRYEAGTSQPTLDVIKHLAQALSCTADELVFGDDPRGPSDDLRIEFEALSDMSKEEKTVVKEVLAGLILRYQAKRLS